MEEVRKELRAGLALQHWHLPDPVCPASGKRAKSCRFYRDKSRCRKKYTEVFAGENLAGD